jgi:hypothetical protein
MSFNSPPNPFLLKGGNMTASHQRTAVWYIMIVVIPVSLPNGNSIPHNAELLFLLCLLSLLWLNIVVLLLKEKGVATW